MCDGGKMAQQKIYKGVACLEATAAGGEKWWYQPGNLAYAPIPIADIKRVVAGRIGVKKVLAVPVQWGARRTMVALNLPRTDLWTLKEQGFLPQNYQLPDAPPTYTEWPEEL